MRININAIHFSADRKLKEHITNRVMNLEKYFQNIIEANVTLKLENTGRVRDKIVELQLSVPGNVIFGTATDKRFEKATVEAISSMRRQVVKYKQRRRAR